ncbi:MAG: amidohydrolase family protein [Egibacteraceae bacterium]
MRLLFDCVRTFDGLSVLPEANVLVKDGRIASVGPPGPTPPGADVVAGRGRTLLPGLIDCHTHVQGTALAKSLVFGVTTSLDMFTDHRMAAEFRAGQEASGAVDRADLYSAGTLVTAPSGHGTQFLPGIPTITGPEQAQTFVDARIAEGSDWIKIAYDDWQAFGHRLPTISRETLTAVIAAAHARGRLAIVHVTTMEHARDAIEARADALAHVFMDRLPPEGFGRLVADHNAFVIPTLSCLESMAFRNGETGFAEDPRLAPYLTDKDIAQLRARSPFSVKPTYDVAETTVRMLHEAGVTVLAGTDAPTFGTMHGVSIHRELELLVLAGLAPVEALAAATSAPATRFGLSDRGRIAPGLRADLLLVRGDPTTDIAATRAIEGVWKLGVPTDRAAYRAQVTARRAKARRQRHAPPPPGSESGLVSDFEDGQLGAAFGAGWSVVTDQMMHGASSAAIEIVEPGAAGTRRCMAVLGCLREHLPMWAGALFSPGSSQGSPANLSSWESLSFWIRSDGSLVNVAVLSITGGLVPRWQRIVAGPDWEQHSFPLSSFHTDGHDVIGVFFAVTEPPGSFVFQIDEVRFT